MIISLCNHLAVCCKLFESCALARIKLRHGNLIMRHVYLATRRTIWLKILPWIWVSDHPTRLVAAHKKGRGKWSWKTHWVVVKHQIHHCVGGQSVSSCRHNSAMWVNLNASADRHSSLTDGSLMFITAPLFHFFHACKVYCPFIFRLPELAFHICF